MNLAPMRYKDYTWPHNPRVYEIGFSRSIVCRKVPFGAYVLQNMGRVCRVLRGEGEFVGEGAYNEFKKLATVFYDNRPGILVHPTWQEANAYFVSLKLREVPTENYVAYSFEFWESFDQYGDVTEAGQYGYGEPGTSYHVLKNGESFWSVAAKYGGAVRLLQLNPNLRNINSLQPGTRLKIR